MNELISLQNYEFIMLIVLAMYPIEGSNEKSKMKFFVFN